MGVRNALSLGGLAKVVEKHWLEPTWNTPFFASFNASFLCKIKGSKICFMSSIIFKVLFCWQQILVLKTFEVVGGNHLHITVFRIRNIIWRFGHRKYIFELPPFWKVLTSVRDSAARIETCSIVKCSFILSMLRYGLVWLKIFYFFIVIILEMIRKKTTIVFNLQNMFRIFLYPSSVAIISNC